MIGGGLEVNSGNYANYRAVVPFRSDVDWGVSRTRVLSRSQLPPKLYFDFEQRPTLQRSKALT